MNTTSKFSIDKWKQAIWNTIHKEIHITGTSFVHNKVFKGLGSNTHII